MDWTLIINALFRGFCFVGIAIFALGIGIVAAYDSIEKQLKRIADALERKSQ